MMLKIHLWDILQQITEMGLLEPAQKKFPELVGKRFTDDDIFDMMVLMRYQRKTHGSDFDSV